MITTLSCGTATDEQIACNRGEHLLSAHRPGGTARPYSVWRCRVADGGRFEALEWLTRHGVGYTCAEGKETPACALTRQLGCVSKLRATTP